MNLKAKVPWFASPPSIAGCATTDKSYAPDGRVAYMLNCSGLARGWDKCFAAAGILWR